jgi:hypothetical protein
VQYRLRPNFLSGDLEGLSCLQYYQIKSRPDYRVTSPTIGAGFSRHSLYFKFEEP